MPLGLMGACGDRLGNDGTAEGKKNGREGFELCFFEYDGYLVPGEAPLLVALFSQHSQLAHLSTHLAFVSTSIGVLIDGMKSAASLAASLVNSRIRAPRVASFSKKHANEHSILLQRLFRGFAFPITVVFVSARLIDGSGACVLVLLSESMFASIRGGPYF